MSLLVRPYLTEKTLADQQAYNRYTFLVSSDATKGQIKELVEKLYKVNVVKITTNKQKSQTVRSNRTGKYENKPAYKKAIVQLKPKQTIKLFKTQ